MLLAEKSPNLMAIEIKGDYQDFEMLIKGIRTLFHCANKQTIIEYDKAYILDINTSLLLELAFARDGNSKFLLVENGAKTMGTVHLEMYTPDESEVKKLRRRFLSGNLYYSFRSPIINTIAYLFYIDELLIDIQNNEETFQDGESFSEWLEMLAALQQFRAVLSGAIESILGKAIFNELMLSKRKSKLFQDYDSIFVDYLSFFYLSRCCDIQNDDKDKIIYYLARLLLKQSKHDLIDDNEMVEKMQSVPDYAGFPHLLLELKEKSEDGEIYMDEVFPDLNIGTLQW